MISQATTPAKQNKKKEDKLRPYQKIHYAIKRGRKRRRTLIITLIVWAIITIAGFFVTKDAFTLTEHIFGLSIIFMLGSFVTLMVILARETVSASSTEEKLVDVAISFLKEQNYSIEILKTIDKRAEVGGSAGQIRTLFQIFSIPFIISGTIYLYQTPFFVYAISWCFLIFFVFTFSFFEEIDRANNDTIIRQAIAEYICLDTQEQPTLKQESSKPVVKRLTNVLLACCFLLTLRWISKR